MLDLQKYIDLYPGIFEAARTPTSNLYLLTEVIVNQLEISRALFDQVEDLKDLNNLAGINLDRKAADYGISRDSRTDEDLLIFLLAKINSTVDGNQIDSIINFLNFILVPGTYELVELFTSAVGNTLDASFLLDGNTLLDTSVLILDGSFLLDGTQALDGTVFLESAAFSIQTDGPLTPTEESQLQMALDSIKAGGVKAYINLLP